MLLWSRILAIIIVVSTLTSCALIMDKNLVSHSLEKREQELNISALILCWGPRDVSRHAVLDKVCEDCENLFREREIYKLCREDCYVSDYFPGCVEVLMLTDRIEEYKRHIMYIRGSWPHELLG